MHDPAPSDASATPSLNAIAAAPCSSGRNFGTPIPSATVSNAVRSGMPMRSASINCPGMPALPKPPIMTLAPPKTRETACLQRESVLTITLASLRFLTAPHAPADENMLH